jgi:methionyl-tRNA synthetase
VIPASADRLLDQLGVAAEARDLAALGAPLAAGAVLPAPQGVFPRLEMPVEA